MAQLKKWFISVSLPEATRKMILKPPETQERIRTKCGLTTSKNADSNDEKKRCWGIPRAGKMSGGCFASPMKSPQGEPEWLHGFFRSFNVVPTSFVGLFMFITHREEKKIESPYTLRWYYSFSGSTNWHVLACGSTLLIPWYPMIYVSPWDVPVDGLWSSLTALTFTG